MLRFFAIDGLHEAEMNFGTVKLKMIDVENIKNIDEDFELNMSSPHFVKYVENLENFDVYKMVMLSEIRERYAQEGINVNFVEKNG